MSAAAATMGSNWRASDPVRERRSNFIMLSPGGGNAAPIKVTGEVAYFLTRGMICGPPHQKNDRSQVRGFARTHAYPHVRVEARIMQPSRPSRQRNGNHHFV
jgi:hypothetical protein